MGDKLRVVLSGIYFPVAIVRYFQAAFRRRDDVHLYTVGPYTGRAIPWAGGMFVDCPLPQPHLVLPNEWNSTQITYVENLLPWEPDLWINVNAGYTLRGHPLKGKYFVIGTDPHCLNYDYDRTQADVFFNMQKPYMNENDVWLPYAYDPVYHHIGNSEQRVYDFGIIGADGRQGPLYLSRDHLVSALRARGYKVLQEFGKAYDECADLMHQCKVGLNWSTRQDTTARVFETMALGCALLTNRTPDLPNLGFVEGRDYEGFADLREALLKAELLMNGDTRWTLTSREGSLAVREHSWDTRVQEILNHV